MTEKLSQDSLAEATRDRAQFSGHGKAKGAAGYREVFSDPDSEFLSASGQTTVINPRPDGFGTMKIAAAWDNIVVAESKGGILGKLVKKVTRQGVDIDLGCLYEMQDGTRGCIQAFGEMMGDFNETPFITLSGDERTGDAVGEDEFLRINGSQWGQIKRVLVYAYIYKGAACWADIRPQIQVSIPGEHPMVVTPAVSKSELAVCAIATLENLRDGMRLTNHSEYFPGHDEMDRAFGFGITWADGEKK
ncbi:MAG: Tellurium resistance protein TerA [Micavibrio sp.]|nr:Tellurium resistance protein TerA [Micavibrio sp.]